MKSVVLLLTLATGVNGRVQQQQHDHATMANAAGGTSTLSAEQVAQLLAGEGMGLAKAAELNHYPGPKHALELAGELELTPEQLRRLESIRTEMLAAAKKAGAALVEAERTLDRSFEHQHVDSARLDMLTGSIGRLQGELRAIHLRAHLSTRALLSPEQIARYDKLRGHGK